MADTAAPTTAPPSGAPPVPQPAAPQVDGTGPGNAAFGLLAEGGFVAKLGAGLRLAAEDLTSAEGVDLSTLPQPLPGVRLTRAKWDAPKKRLKVDASLAVPHLEAANISIRVDSEGKASFEGKLQKRLQLAALNNPLVTLTLSEDGTFGGSVTVGASDLTPKGLKSLTVTGGGTLTIQNGLFSGNVDATLAYAKLGDGEVHFAVAEGGVITGSGKLKVRPPFLNEVGADLALAEDGNLNGTITVSMTEAASPVPALSLTGGTLTVSYANGAVSGSLTEFRAAYRGLADLTASASISAGAFSGEGSLALTVPGLKEAAGQVRVRDGAVSGTMTLGADAFPKALPVKSGRITATLSENGRVGFSGNVSVELGPAGTGQLAGAYSEAGELSLSATINLTVPGLQGAQVSVAYVNGDISGEAQVPIDPSLIPGLTGNAIVRYQQNLWSGETELAYSADDGKLSGRIRVVVAQNEKGGLELGGSGEVEAQIAPRLRGTLTATLLPAGGVDVSGKIVVTEPLELFPEQRFDKELFKYSQNIPLWAILVAVIRVRAGVRGGIGAGVFRNITVEGSYTIGNTAADPTFSISGEMFIPAFIEAYVAFGAGLGLDVVLGSLTGGIEGVATAGLYGAISVIPELAYADGDWSIEGTATLAAGARLKVGLNAWAEIEALWVTVWEETWQLGEWVWNVGPDLALQAHMAYHFGQPGPPEVEFKSSDIDTESMIKEAMPKDGPAPSGAKEALENKAEWKGALKEQKQAALPPDLAAQSQAPPPAPPQPAKQPEPKAGPPTGGAGAPAAPGQAAAQAPAGTAAAPPGSPAAADAAAAAAASDTSAKGAVPASEVPTATQPRYPAPISLATIDEPPAPLPRTKDQEQEDVTAATKAVELVVAQAKDSDALDDWFPRIKNRFRLVDLGFVGDFQSGFSIEGGINPPLKITRPQILLKGTGIPANLKKKPVKYETDTVGGSTVGLAMTADPLGPDHPDGSPTKGGQTKLMDQLPTDPNLSVNDKYVRGHLLNEDLGGPGEDKNLFPITARANTDHYHSVEKTVKEWVDKDKGNLWVRYQVTVETSGQLVELKNGLNAIDSTLNILVSTLDASLEPVETFSLRIESRFDPSKFKAGEDSGLEPASGSAVAPNINEGTPTEPATFPENMRRDLAVAHQRHKIAGTQKLIAEVYNIGEARMEALYAAYNLAQSRGTNDISELDRATLTQFNVVKGLWPQIAAAIA